LFNIILAPFQPSLSSSLPVGLKIKRQVATLITGLGGFGRDFKKTSSF